MVIQKRGPATASSIFENFENFDQFQLLFRCFDNIVSRNSSHECSVERAAAARVQGPTCHIFLFQQTITKTVHTRHHNTEWSHHDASQNATISNGDPPQHDQASEQEKCSDQCPHHQSLTTPAPPQVKSKILQKPLFNYANL